MRLVSKLISKFLSPCSKCPIQQFFPASLSKPFAALFSRLWRPAVLLTILRFLHAACGCDRIYLSVYL
jgi:hypothetical protein